MKSTLNLEDTFFTRARLGRHWTPAAARDCAAFFPTPYRFDAAKEREFQATRRTDYNENLHGQLADTPPLETTNPTTP